MYTTKRAKLHHIIFFLKSFQNFLKYLFIFRGAAVAFTFGGIILVVIFVLVFCCCCDECPIYHRLFSTGKNPGKW